MTVPKAYPDLQACATDAVKVFAMMPAQSTSDSLEAMFAVAVALDCELRLFRDVMDALDPEADAHVVSMFMDWVDAYLGSSS